LEAFKGLMETRNFGSSIRIKVKEVQRDRILFMIFLKTLNHFLQEEDLENEEEEVHRDNSKNSYEEKI